MAAKIELWYKNSAPKNITQPFISGTAGTQMLPNEREAGEMSPAPMSCLSRVKRGLFLERPVSLSSLH